MSGERRNEPMNWPLAITVTTIFLWVLLYQWVWR
jgi:hypothetical protein